MTINDNAPSDAHCFIKGQYFKVGRFNRVFVHKGGEWVLTNGMTVDRMSREIIKQDAEETIKPNKRARYAL